MAKSNYKHFKCLWAFDRQFYGEVLMPYRLQRSILLFRSFKVVWSFGLTLVDVDVIKMRCGKGNGGKRKRTVERGHTTHLLYVDILVSAQENVKY